MAGSALAPGTWLSGRYRLLELIGQSDLSQVYAASDQRGQAQVALKVFDRAVLGRSHSLSEYQAQARQASGLGVEGIARAYDFGIDANSGLPFSTTEQVGWSSLDRRVLAQGPMSVADLSRALAVLARALDAAHAAGLVHRDLKPQNVFVSADNPEWVRITDFGMTAVRRGAPEAMGWGGPPGYTPPEAVDASAPGTASCDVFALGVIAFFALTRSTPFRSLRSGFDPNQHWTELNRPLDPLSERATEMGVTLDPALDPWFSRALALSPEQRFRSAFEMARELSAISERMVPRGPRGTVGIPVPGIAAAIAQPLFFQPEPSPASFGLSPAPPVAAAPAPAPEAPPPSIAPPPVSLLEPAGVPKKNATLPLLIGLGIVLLSGVAFGGYLLLGERSPPATAASDPSVAPSNLPAVTPSAPASPPTVSSAAPSAAPESPAPAATPEPATPPSAPERAAEPPKPVAAAPKPQAAPKAQPPKTNKPAEAKPAEAKPASTKPKKKCSTFLGCK